MVRRGVGGAATALVVVVAAFSGAADGDHGGVSIVHASTMP